MVAKGICSIIVAHGISLHIIPDSQVVEKKFAVGKCSRSCIPDTYLAANKIDSLFKTSTAANHKLGWGAVKVTDRQNVLIFFRIFFHHTVQTLIDMTGIDNSHGIFTGVYFAQIFNRTCRCLGQNTKFFNVFYRLVG